MEQNPLRPLILDQFHHAHRLHVAGIAPRPVPMEKIAVRELTAARLRASDGCGGDV